MADDKTKRAPQDAKLISLNEDYEVEYWTRKFGVTRRATNAKIEPARHRRERADRRPR
jgi:hypothetical protein